MAFYNGNLLPVDDSDIQHTDLGATAQTINERGTTIVSLGVKILENGEIYIRAKTLGIAIQGPMKRNGFNFLG